ncbi:MAG: hypothetical protein QNJ94_09095 [Alphaproteobacteria bacterium]|nr:hypothetical protein [Alphaproteobacteria bacterium]
MIVLLALFTGDPVRPPQPTVETKEPQTADVVKPAEPARTPEQKSAAAPEPSQAEVAEEAQPPVVAKALAEATAEPAPEPSGEAPAEAAAEPATPTEQPAPAAPAPSVVRPGAPSVSVAGQPVALDTGQAVTLYPNPDAGGAFMVDPQRQLVVLLPFGMVRLEGPIEPGEFRPSVTEPAAPAPAEQPAPTLAAPSLTPPAAPRMTVAGQPVALDAGQAVSLYPNPDAGGAFMVDPQRQLVVLLPFGMVRLEASIEPKGGGALPRSPGSRIWAVPFGRPQGWIPPGD